MDECFWKRTKIHTPRFDMITNRLMEIRRARKPACIVVPIWDIAWKTELYSYSVASIKLGIATNVFEKKELHLLTQGNVWQMAAHIIVPEKK